MGDIVYALVDYDNQRPPTFGRRASAGNRPNLRDHEDYIADLIRRLLEFRERLKPAFLELRVRLYGGWATMRQGENTEIGDMVAQAIDRHGYSTRGRRTRLFLEMAESVLAVPDEILIGTFRSSRWRGEALRFAAQPGDCAESPNACSLLAIFSEWSRGRCPRRPACSVQANDIVRVDAQKLVDTMLVADTISGAAYHGAHVLTVSMDDDIVPGVLSARALGGQVSVLRFGRVDPSAYDPILLRHGVEIFDLPALGI
jgi:hypothetical protein